MRHALRGAFTLAVLNAFLVGMTLRGITDGTKPWERGIAAWVVLASASVMLMLSIRDFLAAMRRLPGA